MIVAAFDTETTSKDETRSIVELGIVKWDTETDPRAEVKTYCQRFKPRELITYGAMGVHHITEGEVENCPGIEERINEIFKFVEDADIMMAHNLPFDMEVFTREVTGDPNFFGLTLDTLRLARHTWDRLPDYRLASLRYRFDLICDKSRHADPDAPYLPASLVASQHSAGFDAYLCLAMASACQKTLDMPWKDLPAKAASPLTVRIMNFGKCNGMEVSEMVVTERGYAEWLLRQPWLQEERPDLKWTLLGLMRKKGEKKVDG